MKETSMHREENQLDVTEWFIALIICLTCFGHFYAHHQELETMCALLLPMVCSAWVLVVRGQEQGSILCPGRGMLYNSTSRATYHRR